MLVLLNGRMKSPGLEKRFRKAAWKFESGAGMVEVMIAVVIAAFALIGFAGLQVASLKNQKTSHFRMLASQYAGEIGDRVRANLDGAKSAPGVNLNINSYNPAPALYPNIPSVMPTCANASKCTSAEVAAIDIYKWLTSLQSGLAGGWGEISGNAQQGYVVRVYFREPSKIDGATDPNCRAAALANAADKETIRCFLTVITP